MARSQRLQVCCPVYLVNFDAAVPNHWKYPRTFTRTQLCGLINLTTFGQGILGVCIGVFISAQPLPRTYSLHLKGRGRGAKHAKKAGELPAMIGLSALAP
jgi:hypothetical protein